MSEPGFTPLVEALSGVEDAFQPWAGSAFIPQRAPEPQIDEYARGLADGQQLAATAFAQERARLQQLIAAAQALQPVEPEAVRELILSAVDRLVREIVGAAPVDPDMLRQQVDDAIEFAGPIEAGAMLRLSPGDLALLDGVQLPVEMRADPALPAGTLRIDTEHGSIEHGRAPRLEALRLQLGLPEGE